jgi:hypothetical protein
MSLLKSKKKKLPTLLKRTNTAQRLNNKKADILKFMTKSNIIPLFDKISHPKITNIEMEIIDDDNLYNHLDNSTKTSYNIKFTKSKKKYELKRLVLKINSITFESKKKKIFDPPIFFFKSTGTSRNVDTKDIWFPTAANPVHIDILSGDNRITKLEDTILMSGIIPKDNSINIDEYGRFLTLENAIISKYLLKLMK